MFKGYCLAVIFAMLWCVPGWTQVSIQAEAIRLEEQGTVHRVSIALPAGATLQSVYSDSAHPLTVEAGEGLYQSDANALLAQGADADDTDSWFTIGLPEAQTDVQSTGGTGWDAAVAAFEEGATFHSADAFGGAFYLLPVSDQGQAVSGEVLVGQFVSTGLIELSLNVQWKPAPGQPSELATGLSLTLHPLGWGCTSPSALNYDAEAIFDDGSCSWPIGSFEGLNYSVHQPANDTLPPTYRIYAQLSNPNESLVGWFGSSAQPLSLSTTTSFYQMSGGGVGFPEGNPVLLERDSWVTLGEASSSIIVGLNSADFEAGGALASDPEFGGGVAAYPGSNAGSPDSSGLVLMAQVTTDGAVTFTTNVNIKLQDDSEQQVLGVQLTIPGSVPGCMDSTACNFNAAATMESGECLALDALGVCGGDCATDEDEDGVCDSDEVFGCTDPLAVNYNADATEEDGTCIAEPEVDTTATGFIGLVQQEVGVGPGGAVLHRIYAQFDSAGYEVISIFGSAETPWKAEAEAGFYQSPDGGPLATNLPLVSTATSPYDSWFTIGGDANGSVDLIAVGVDFGSFEAGGNFLESDATGGAIIVIPGTQPAAVAGEDGRVLLGQFTSTGTIDLLLNLKFTKPNGAAPQVTGLTLTIPPAIGGCNDAAACNYDATATANDGSCIYAEAGYDCFGVCLGDLDGDGICDANEYSGCTDTLACNFDPFVDASNGLTSACEYPLDVFGAVHFDCSGNCFNDTDGDGVCDEDEQDGCTYPSACNYDPAASEEDGSCVFAEPWKDCSGQCWFDFNGDGICDEPGSGGCTYPAAYNYSSTAAYDDGTCEFPTGDCRFDSNGDGGVNISDLLDMLVALGATCP